MKISKENREEKGVLQKRQPKNQIKKNLKRFIKVCISIVVILVLVRTPLQWVKKLNKQNTLIIQSSHKNANKNATPNPTKTSEEGKCNKWACISKRNATRNTSTEGIAKIFKSLEGICKISKNPLKRIYKNHNLPEKYCYNECFFTKHPKRTVTQNSKF